MSRKKENWIFKLIEKNHRRWMKKPKERRDEIDEAYGLEYAWPNKKK